MNVSLKENLNVLIEYVDDTGVQVRTIHQPGTNLSRLGLPQEVLDMAVKITTLAWTPGVIAAVRARG